MRLRAAISALSLVGAAVAAYLTYTHYADVAPICTSGACEKVQQSSYAELVGVPVAVLGLLAYAALLVTAGIRGAWWALAGAALAVAGAAFASYLLWAQVARIHATCLWCLGNDVVILALAALCCARVLVEPVDSPGAGQRGPRVRDVCRRATDLHRTGFGRTSRRWRGLSGTGPIARQRRP